MIGLPGVGTAVPVAAERGTASLGQQGVVALGRGLRVPNAFQNPAKYDIPAGGAGGDHGPSLRLLRRTEQQTLVNGSVLNVLDPYYNDGGERHTARMSFGKYLREPGEVEIDPFQSTLLLYAVSSLDDEGDPGVGNPKWRSTFLKFLDSSTADVPKLGLVRTRKREHVVF